MALRLALLFAVTALCGMAGLSGPSAPWFGSVGPIAIVWSLALGVAAALCVRGLQPPRDVRVGPLPPWIGGTLSALLILANPTPVGAALAVGPLAVTAHLHWMRALRHALADVPFEQWEAAWLLGATRTQAVRHVAIPAATGLRAHLVTATVQVTGGLVIAVLALGWTA